MVGELKEEICRIEEICRERSKEICLSERGNIKAEVWICGDILLPNGKETKCSECGVICYYDTKLKNQMKKKHKKICLKCAWENHLEEMGALEQSIIRQVGKIRGWIKS